MKRKCPINFHLDETLHLILEIRRHERIHFKKMPKSRIEFIGMGNIHD